MNTPDTVGGLPAKWREAAEHGGFNSQQAHILRLCAAELELCRAAPAGGDDLRALVQSWRETAKHHMRRAKSSMSFNESDSWKALANQADDHADELAAILLKENAK